MNEVKNYTVAVYAGPAPVTPALLLTCSHPKVVNDVAEVCLTQAAREAVDMPEGEEKTATLEFLEGVETVGQEATQEAKQS